jgi:streptomycin 6-kinase
VITVPEAFAEATVKREGQPGAAWLADLPGIVDDLLDRWPVKWRPLRERLAELPT